MIPIENNTESDDIAWAERAQYWEKEANPSHSKKETAKHRVKEATQLILTYHVVQLCIDHGAILVCKGFTHYPQKRQEWRLFPSYKKIPSRIILLDIDGSLSSDMVK